MRYLIIALLFTGTLYSQRNGSVMTSYYNSKSITESVGFTLPEIPEEGDSTFLHFYTGCTPSFEYVGTAGEIRYPSIAAFCDTIVNVQQTNQAYEWTATHDVDSVSFYLNPSRNDISTMVIKINGTDSVEFNIPPNSVTNEFDTSFVFSANSGDVIGIESGTWYFLADAAVFFNTPD